MRFVSGSKEKSGAIGFREPGKGAEEWSLGMKCPTRRGAGRVTDPAKQIPPPKPVRVLCGADDFRASERLGREYLAPPKQFPPGKHVIMPAETFHPDFRPLQPDGLEHRVAAPCSFHRRSMNVVYAMQ